MNKPSDPDDVMRDYYRVRAPVYDRVYGYPERQADLDYLRSVLPPVFAGLDLLEVAAGTGYWTALFAGEANRVTATDVTPEAMALIAERGVPESVSSQAVDAYRLFDLGQRYSAAFAGLWISHVPVARRAEFFGSLHSVLEDGSPVVFIDNTIAQCERLPITHTDADGNTYQDRETDDGEVHRVLKNFPDEASLTALVSDCAEEVTFSALEHFWVFRYRYHSPQLTEWR